MHTAMPERTGYASIVQKIYDRASEGEPIDLCLHDIAAHIGVEGLALSVETRDGQMSKLVRTPTPSSAGTWMTIGRLEDSPGEQRASLAGWYTTETEIDETVAEQACDFLRHLARAVSLQQAMESRLTENRIYSAVLDRLAVGAIILDQRGQIVRCSGIAHEILEARDGLRPYRGSISACDEMDDKRLQAVLRAMLAGHVDTPQTLVLGRENGARGLGLVVQRIEKPRNCIDLSSVVIFLRDPMRGNEPEKTMLRHLFDLTPAEAELARNLSAGLSLDEAAAELSISRNTARAHLRAIFSKSGITRQTELIRLMLTSAAMLGGVR